MNEPDDSAADVVVSGEDRCLRKCRSAELNRRLARGPEE